MIQNHSRFITRLFQRSQQKYGFVKQLSTSLDDDDDDIFGLSGCKKDKRFYARCYRLLELDNDSSQDLVRKQYLKLAKVHHPDTGQAASLKRFQRIDQAYRELMSKFAADKRKEEESIGEYGLYYTPKDEDSEATNNETIEADIDHIAPQHRQYLNNEGFGYGNPFQRQKQYQKYRAMRAQDSVTEHTVQKLTSKYETQLAVQKDGKRAKKQATKNAMERLVEDLISESMAKGDFDNLSGAGKPLPERVIYNPYEDFTTHKMNQILVDGGFAPEWIMLKKDIDKMIDDFRINMDKQCIRILKTAVSVDSEKVVEKIWQKFCNDNYRDNEIILINKTIDKYNLMVPMIQSQKFHLDMDKEMSKIWKCHWAKKDTIRAKKKEEPVELPPISIIGTFLKLVSNKF